MEQNRDSYIPRWKAFLDLTRAHFAIVWPLLFLSGLFLAFETYGGFDWGLVVKAFLIGLFGFEAGMVLNDVIDHRIDEKDVEDSMTQYWRPFSERPIPAGRISFGVSIVIVVIFMLIAFGIILTLPHPHRRYLLLMIPLTYGLESFYNLKKRHQKFPLAQLFGRMDFTLFPIAGYLLYGHPDLNTLLYFLFFYPLALAHLGVNDLGDVRNDQARGLHTITTLYDVRGTLRWIGIASLLHFVTTVLFLTRLGQIASIGFGLGMLLVLLANLIIFRKQTPAAALKALPFVHAALLVYVLTLMIDTLL